ncbi:hypothetical protein HC248_00882 [Polaromonas vacuolata]|uniref:DUF547 domain-containing protein n=1 Tax=Polaromonas vacuolata TaxID=37448 RepID=A0A6H2H6U7_9BURK|nr:DUF547 domain-containing protein [Polaromonas vacuolata]QJC55601.1 hypothetical protein HC248_00882 [Polaromonas vacuolata]
MIKYFLAALLALQCLVVQAAGFDHSVWDGLLKKHVITLRAGQATQVDYKGMSADHSQLNGYLTKLSAVTRADFDQWDKATQLAYLINAYNAYTVELVLTAYPKLESIKDLGNFFQSPWKKEFFQLLEKKRSLDAVEHELIRGSGRYNEPRIHFAVNCASIGCPALRAQAYVGEQIDAQLEDATKSFLSDRTRNRLEGDSLKISNIFKWYAGDFEKGWRGAKQLNSFLLLYRQPLGLTNAAAAALASGSLNIDYLEYDWRLNSTVASQ